MRVSRGKDKALRGISEAEEWYHGLEAGRNVSMDRALKSHLADREHLMQRRYELVSGRSEPTAAELAGYQGPALDSHATGKGKGLPFFWLNVLRSQDIFNDAITPRDAKALGYLMDIRFVRGLRGLLVEFVFAENPYFENTILRRGVYVECDASGQAVSMREEATEIAWREGACLLTREVRKKGGAGKKGKKGAKGSNRRRRGDTGPGELEAEDEGRRRFKACPSFFRFFTPLTASTSTRSKVVDPTAADDDDEEEEADVEEEELHAGEDDEGGRTAVQMRREREGDMLELLVKAVIPRAATLYLEGTSLTRGPGTDADEDEDAEETEDDAEGFQLVSGSMQGAHGGDVSSLPPRTQQIVHVLKSLQSDMDALMLTFKRAKWQVKAEAEAKVQEMADKRRGFINGPPDQEGPAVPNFWLRALRGMEIAIDCVQRKDARALSYLEDVRLVWDFKQPMPSPDQPTRHAALELYFRPGNPYFPTRVLRKRYTFQGAGGSASKLRLVSSDVEVGPEWREGRDLTVKAAPGGGGAGDRLRPAASFFALFKKGALRQAFNIVGEGRQAQQQAVQKEEELLNEVQCSLMPRAYQLYSLVDLDDELPDDDEDEDEDEEGVEGEEEGEAAEGDALLSKTKLAARGSRGRCPRAASSPSSPSGESSLQGLSDLWRRLTGQWLLLLLLGLFLLGQVFLFLEMIPHARAFLGLS